MESREVYERYKGRNNCQRGSIDWMSRAVRMDIYRETYAIRIIRVDHDYGDES